MQNPSQALLVCQHCQAHCNKKGLRNGYQRLRCSSCNKYQQHGYRYKACAPGVDQHIVTFVKEGCGIRSIGRILRISPTTVIARIRRIAARTHRPGPVVMGGCYEVDELATYCGNKRNRVWLAYAMDRSTRQVVDLAVGKRSKRVLGPLLRTLLLSSARCIATDGLDLYRTLLPKAIHRTKRHGTNHIERMNLTLRTHLKRLGRRTLCATKSVAMLRACAVIYCWG